MSDLISRQAAIDALIEWYGCKPNDIEAFEEIIEALPSAEAEPNSCEYWDSESHFCALRRPQAEPIKHGHWIWRGGNLYECSECGAIVVAQDYIPIELHYFCRGCGAKMVEVTE